MQKVALKINKENRKKRIIEATIDVITSENFVNLNLEEVVAKARTSKSAIYDLFENREGLLVAVLDHIMFNSRNLKPTKISFESPIKVHLMHYIESFLSVGHGKEFAAVMRVIYGNIPLSENIAKRYFEIGVKRTTANLQRYLEIKVSEGKLDIDNCNAAAKHLIGGLVWYEQVHVICKGEISVSYDEMHKDATVLVDAFIKSYTVQ